MESGRFGAKFPLTRGEYDAQIVALYRDNHSMAEIARLFNSSTDSVKKRLLANNVELRAGVQGGPTNNQGLRKRVQAYQLYTAGVPMDEIARRLGYKTKRSVYTLLEGVPRRHPEMDRTRKTASTATTEGTSS